MQIEVWPRGALAFLYFCAKHSIFFSDSLVFATFGRKLETLRANILFGLSTNRKKNKRLNWQLIKSLAARVLEPFD